ncbi:MAG: hypothetical protein GYB67_00225 [Chloroflexi bacterium]|nr:hypothetical protein [Chloroflexota bacterium]
MDTTIQVFTVLILLVTLVSSTLVTQFIRRRRTLLPVRRLPAYELMPVLVGESIERGLPIHVSLGSTGLGANNTVLTLASAEVFYAAAQRAATGTVAPLLTLSDTSVIPLGYGTLRRAYAARDRLSRFRRDSIRWLPAGPRSLAFAGAVTALLSTERVSANILVGSYGPELALILDTAYRRGQASVATSNQLEGQAIAYALADRPLIGEEIFVAPAYLGDPSAASSANVFTLDVLRWLLVIAILVSTVVAVIEPVREAVEAFFFGGG